MLDNSLIKTPREIVEELDKHIIGQNEAKRAVAIALRNRHRRKFVSNSLKNEITPKNILMIGSTGVGKTEIARRLAKMENAPFIKIEATKFTEIGYVGRDVESIIRDLIEISIKLVREDKAIKFEKKSLELAEEKILDLLLNENKVNYFGNLKDDQNRQILKKKLINGELNNNEIEIEISQVNTNFDFASIPGMENMSNHFPGFLELLPSNKKKKKKLAIKDALDLLKEEELDKFVNKDDIKKEAIKRAEENGIIFLDEIDKIVQSSERKGYSDISREGVQRDLLPLLDGSNVMTKYGMVKTDHILFIAAGAFHISKPSDLIPELQGRLPICVKLHSLTEEDFVKILLEPDYSLIRQYKDLLNVEGVNLIFSDSSIYSIAYIAHSMNQVIENIGARRLHAVMEKLLENILFEAGDSKFGDFIIDTEYVHKKLKNFSSTKDLNKFIL